MFLTAKEMRYKVYCTDRSSNFENKSLCDNFFKCDATDMKSIDRYYRHIRPLGIISSGYHGLVTVAEIVSKFKKWGSSPNAVQKVMDKNILRRFMNGIKHVETDYRMISDLAGLEKAIKEISYPVIIKNKAANCGSRDIHVLKNSDDYLNFKNSYSANIGKEFLVERYYDWDTFGMIGIMNKGKLICHHFFRELNRGELYPTEYEISSIDDGIERSLNKNITSYIVKYLNKSDYRNGPIDVDLLISPSRDKYRIIEIDPLLEGDLLVEHIDLCTGMNMNRILLSLVAQEECPKISKSFFGHAVIKFFKDPSEKQAILELIKKDKAIKKALHGLYINNKVVPKENTARDKWRYGYASFLFYNKRSLSYFRKVI